MRVIAETPNVRLLCDGNQHWTEGKRTGLLVAVPVQACDCKDGKGLVADPADLARARMALTEARAAGVSPNPEERRNPGSR